MAYAKAKIRSVRRTKASDDQALIARSATADREADDQLYVPLKWSLSRHQSRYDMQAVAPHRSDFKQVANNDDRLTRGGRIFAAFEY